MDITILDAISKLSDQEKNARILYLTNEDKKKKSQITLHLQKIRRDNNTIKQLKLDAKDIEKATKDELMSRMKPRMQEMEAKVTQLNMKVTELNTKVTQLNTKLQEKNKEIENLQANYNSLLLNFDHLHYLNMQQFRQHHEQYIKVNDQLKHSKALIETHEETISTLNSQFEDLRQLLQNRSRKDTYRSSSVQHASSH